MKEHEAMSFSSGFAKQKVPQNLLDFFVSFLCQDKNEKKHQEKMNRSTNLLHIRINNPYLMFFNKLLLL